jgi:hypothetical protein
MFQPALMKVGRPGDMAVEHFFISERNIDRGEDGVYRPEAITDEALST